MKRYTPYAYQQYCRDAIINNPCVGLFVDMGLGKTAITLDAINELKRKKFKLAKLTETLNGLVTSTRQRSYKMPSTIYMIGLRLISV